MVLVSKVGGGKIRKTALLFLMFVLLAAGIACGFYGPSFFDASKKNHEISQVISDNNSSGESYVLKKNIPVLMYHEIGSPRGRYKELYVEPVIFAEQLDWLRKNGYSTVSLQEVCEHWKKNKPLPENPVVITFDDGYRSMYETVLPLLKEREMKATFFIVPGFSDSPLSLSNDMIAAMSKSGMEIGCHTYSHADLIITPEDRLRHELGDSRAYLERIIEKPVNFFAYPAGRFDGNAARNVEKYGYQAAVTTLYGFTSYDQNPYMWKRIRIENSDGLIGMIKKLGVRD